LISRLGSLLDQEFNPLRMYERKYVKNMIRRFYSDYQNCKIVVTRD
jgi:hypothetical protein